MKRFIALMLVVLMTVTCFVGCAKKNEGTVESNTPVVEETKEVPVKFGLICLHDE